MINVVNDKVKALLCENQILEQLMAIPVTEILSYARKAGSVAPEDALSYLAEMYIDNCGVSTGLRSLADYCSVYWIERLKQLDGKDFASKYGDAQILPELLPFFSEAYTEEIDDYDITFLTDVELRDMLIEELQEASDERTKIILCAGVCDFLPHASNDRWLDHFTMDRIENGIVNLGSKILMRHRCFKDVVKYFPPYPSCKVKNKRFFVDEPLHLFTAEEVHHFELLNNRLVELQREVMAQVREITLNLQAQIAKGFHQYDTFNVEGLIYIEDMEDEVNSLLNTLAHHARYSVMISNDRSTPEVMDEMNAMENHWYGNWSGIFQQLESQHGLKVCRAFCKMFEEARVFTIADIMKITPEMLFKHVEINI